MPEWRSFLGVVLERARSNKQMAMLAELVGAKRSNQSKRQFVLLGEEQPDDKDDFLLPDQEDEDKERNKAGEGHPMSAEGQKASKSGKPFTNFVRPFPVNFLHLPFTSLLLGTYTIPPLSLSSFLSILLLYFLSFLLC